MRSRASMLLLSLALLPGVACVEARTPAFRGVGGTEALAISADGKAIVGRNGGTGWIACSAPQPLRGPWHESVPVA